MADSVVGYGPAHKPKLEPAMRPGDVDQRLRVGAKVVAVVALALLTRPYEGLTRDARLYVGRAVANLDPLGVGRDLMFAKDGQSDFSVFPLLLTRLVAWLGPSIASAFVAFAALACWTAAAGLMLGSLAGRERRWGLLAAVLVLPCTYVAPLSFGEALAIPRPFAEALGLLSLWALLCGRRAWAWILALAAATVHPIMAAPVIALLVLELCRDNRRWWLAGLGGAVLAVTGSVLGLPVLRRLVQPIDPQWMHVLRWRNSYLFVEQWSAAAWTRTAVQALTVALGARLLDARGRRIATAVLGLSAGALIITGVFAGGLWRSVLLVQLQPWRTLWMLAVLAAALFPLVICDFWRRGNEGRLAAAALVLAWLGMFDYGIAGAGCLLALGLAVMLRRKVAIPFALLWVGWASVAGVGVILIGFQTSAAWDAWSAPPAPARSSLHGYALLDVYRVLGGALGCLAASLRFRRQRSGLVLGAVLVALSFGVARWDERDGGRRDLEDPTLARRVRELVAARPGPVQWLGGELQPALLAGRPAWQSELQGAGLVFSRDQALEWSRRTHRLVADGMGPPSLLRNFRAGEPPSDLTPTPTALRRFCAEPGAPAWVVAPVARPITPALLQPGVRLLPADRGESMLDWTTSRVVVIAAHAFVPCAG